MLPERIFIGKLTVICMMGELCRAMLPQAMNITFRSGLSCV